MSARKSTTGGHGGGPAGARGYKFQAEAGAYVVAHALSRTPLRWIEGPGPDVPVAVLAETGGPGDDWRVELGGERRIEIQCKRGLTGRDDLWKALARLAKGLAADAALAGVLLVDGTSSGTIRNELREDLGRVGGGRRDDLKEITESFLELLEEKKVPDSICRRLRVVVLDLSPGTDAEKLAVRMLQEAVMKDRAQAAWDALVVECNQLMGSKGRRDTLAWLNYLTSKGIRLLPSPVLPSPGPELKRYLGRVVYQVGQLALDTVDPEAVSGAKERPEVTLGAVYTALLTKSSEGEEMQDERSPGKREMMREGARRLSALETANRHDRLVLLGDPGSGKSTFVSFVALCLAGAGLGKTGLGLDLLTAPLPGEEDEEGQARQPWQRGALVPLRVVLRDFAARGLPAVGTKATEEHLWKFIEELPECREDGCVKALREWLGQQGGLVLFDGLDEVPETEERREQLKDVVESFAAAYSSCRVLVTSRTYAYRQQSWRLRGFREAELAPFTPAQVRHFVDRWYASVAKARGQDAGDASGRAASLKEAIARNARLAELAERPLLLTLMASLHSWRGGDLPERREKLYGEAVDLLLDRWQRRAVARGEKGEQGPRSLLEWLKVDRQRLRRLLEELAFRAHASQPTLEGTADIGGRELVDGLLKLGEGPRVHPADMVEYLSDRAGLLIARGTGVYTFVHRTFQEYLAACHLTANEADPEQLVELLRAEPGRWREVTLLAAARLSEGAGFRLLLDTLCEKEPGGSAGEVGEVWSAHVAGLALGETPDPQRLFAAPGRIAKTAARIRAWMQYNMRGTALPPGERALAALALDRVGDVRFGKNPWKLPDEEMLGFVKVPAGPFLMGSADGDEKPQHKLTLPDYYIGRYPVTVGQFRAYREMAKVSPKDLDALKGASNLPVVWVSWDEAVGYCKWLTKEMQAWERTPPELRRLLHGEDGQKWQVMLPSEAEWEKAARGTDGRRWPWGNEWEAGRANCAETELGGPTPVGCFYDKRNPYGLEEMSGNVWEWTRSLWGGYPYPQDSEDQKKREALTGTGPRVVRGGSFFLVSWFVRCACRYLNHPASLLVHLGFRVALSPFSGL